VQGHRNVQIGSRTLLILPQLCDEWPDQSNIVVFECIFYFFLFLGDSSKVGFTGLSPNHPKRAGKREIRGILHSSGPRRNVQLFKSTSQKYFGTAC